MMRSTLTRWALAAALLILPLLAWSAPAEAQNIKGFTVTKCGTPPNGFNPNGNGYAAGAWYPYLLDLNGNLCITLTGAAPYIPTQLPLDVATVTTGGTAVVAIAAGHRTAGGVISNPITATINLCVNEFTTASGTLTGAQSGQLFCLVPGQSYSLQPSALGVSVISSDSAHPFFGYGLQ